MLPRRLRSEGAGRAGAFALGALAVATYQPVGAFWLAPLLYAALFGLLRDASSARSAAWRGFAFGAGFFCVGVSWIFVSLSVFGGMPPWLAGPATVLFCLAMALYPALGGALFHALRPRRFPGEALCFAAVFAAIDSLRGWFLTGFPWLLVGQAQTSPSPLAGFAPLFGVPGIGLLVLLLAALLWRWRIGLPVLCGVVLVGQGLRQIEWTTPAGPPVSVALVQGNVPQEMKFRPEHFLRTLAHYAQLVEAHPARLVVLPETALPAFFDQLPEAYVDRLAALAQRQGGDLLIGSVLGDGERYWNSAVSLGQSPRQAYRKVHLVPFGEIIPPGFAWFMAMAHIPMSSFSDGPALQPPLAIAGQQVAVNICYEDAFGDTIRRSAAGAGLLVNLSNTAWFGDSLAQPQHLQIARLRAAETGRPLLRATNTGMTAIVGPNGDVAQVLPPFTTAVLQGEVVPRQGETPYLRWGNLPVHVVIAVVLGLAAMARLRRRRSVDR